MLNKTEDYDELKKEYENYQIVTEFQMQKLSRKIRFSRFKLGHQVYIGLPDSTKIDDINTAKNLMFLYHFCFHFHINTILHILLFLQKNLNILTLDKLAY